MITQTLRSFALIGSFAAAALGHAAGLAISSTLGGAAFDPWNTTKWAAWYDGSGRVVKSFVIDTSVTFALDGGGNPVNWQPVLEGVENLFEITTNANYTINGVGTTIDVATSAMSGTIADYYADADKQTGGLPPLLDESAWSPAKTAFFIKQTGTTITAGSFIRNFNLRGFYRAFQTDHAHKRLITLENNTLSRSLIAIFARGQNVVVMDSRIQESLNCGVYGEYASRNWTFRNCVFRDNSVNGLAQSFGDIVLDSCYEYLVQDNLFDAPSVSDAEVPRHRTAISLYRNAGESADIREHAAHDIKIEGNEFAAYHIAMDIGARAGVVDVKDRSLEGRCYTHDITVEDNGFTDCKIGIKINSDQNHIVDNEFSGCDRDIVVQCVFYKSLGQHIVQSAGSAGVWLWSKPADASGFADYCFYQTQSGDRVYEEISDDDRLFQIVTSGSVTLTLPSRPDFTAVVCQDLSLVKGSSLQDMIVSGATPIDIAVANYADHLPGDEIAVIWGQPVSKVDGIDYYSIVIYDQWGLEIDRCGRSLKKWIAIAGGNLLPGKGFINVNAEAEVAAVQELPDDSGCYPIYVFRRGFALTGSDLADGNILKLAATNTLPLADLAVGDFVTGDSYQEVAAISSQPHVSGTSDWRIYYYDPSNTSWSAVTSGFPVPLGSIAAGDFDPSASGDEVAGAGLPSDTVSPIRLFKTGGTAGAYATIASSVGPWTGVAAGNFDANTANGDEVAVSSSTASGGVYEIAYFATASAWLKSYAGAELGVAARALSAGSSVVGAGLQPEEKASGTGFGSDYGAVINPWGDHVAVLPGAPQTEGIPVFFVSKENGSSRTHSRTVPLYR